MPKQQTSVINKFNKAICHAPIRNSSTVSSENVDIVLSPPRNPVIINKRHSGGKCVPANAKTPAPAQAITFATSVPAGKNWVPKTTSVARPMSQRNTPPQPAPIKTKSACNIFMLLGR